MHIIKLDAVHEDDYRCYVRGKDQALLYYSLNYQYFLCDLLKATSEIFLAIDKKNGIQGILPLISKLGPFGKVYNSLPFFGSNGGIIAEYPIAFSCLLEHYNNLVSQPGVAASTLITNPLDNQDYRGIKYNYSDYRIGQLTKISCGQNHVDTLLGMFHYKTRNMIKKAVKLGLQVQHDDDDSQLDFIMAIHSKNMERLQGPRKPDGFFKSLRRYFHAGRDYRIYAVTLNRETIAALLVFYFNKTVEYYLPVVKNEYRNTQALSLAIYEAMLEASKEGFYWWNWGGTWPINQDGVNRFKKRWGTEDKIYSYYVQLNNSDMQFLDKQTILEAYPYFYVLPFHTLSSINNLAHGSVV